MVVRVSSLSSSVGRGCAYLLGAVLISAGCGRASDPPAETDYAFQVPDFRGSWYKGNTHAHTTESDGDSPPEEVALWYKDHGYDFLVLSDHNVLTDPDRFTHLQDSTFLLIAGEEVTSAFEDKPVHVNGLAIREEVQPQSDSTLVGTIQKNVDAIRAVEGAPHINHPNFRWAFGFEELVQIRNNRLLEIWNGHPLVHNYGSEEREDLEKVWDRLLSSGIEVYGIAVDDAHHFKGEFSRDRSNPGRGWVAVRAPELTPGSVVAALEAGHFYASTGVELEDVIVSDSRLEVVIRPVGDFRYRTFFVGELGEILSVVSGTHAVFELTEPLRYVRARVVDSGGALAWTQPVFVQRSFPSDGSSP